MIRFHRLPPEMFDQLADTHGGPAAVELLQQTRYSRALLAIRHIVSRHPALEEVVTSLAAAQEADPHQVFSVLTYLWVSVWLSTALRRPWTSHDRDRLAALAVATCLRAGLNEPGPPLVPAADNTIFLPTLGCLTVSGLGPRLLRQEAMEGPQWSPLRRVLSVTVDDLDAWRDCHGFPVAGRMPEPTWAAWRTRVTAAWRLLADHARERLDELATGLAPIAPLRANAATAGVSATNGEAFGGMASSLPDSPAELAATVVHEFSHSKLHATLALVDLHDHSDRRPYFAPWRDDPRPLMGALQGVYAFTAVAELWHALRAEPTLEKAATLRFAALRAQVNRVAPDLFGSPGLTAAGRRFVAILVGAVVRLDQHVVPAHVDRAARERVCRLEHAWHRRVRLV